jgi:hypothetical protein
MNRFGGYDAANSYALVLVVCDQIINDATTGKRSLIGMFDVVNAQAFPAGLSQLCIYASIAKGESDEHRFYLGIIAPDGQFILQSQLDVADWGERGVCDFDLRLPGIAFPTAGDYLVRLFSDGRVLVERKFGVRIPPGPPPEQVDLPTP